MTSIGLGMPAPPAPVLAPRRTTRQLMVRDVGVGSEHPISIAIRRSIELKRLALVMKVYLT